MARTESPPVNALDGVIGLPGNFRVGFTIGPLGNDAATAGLPATRPTPRANPRAIERYEAVMIWQYRPGPGCYAGSADTVNLALGGR